MPQVLHVDRVILGGRLVIPDLHVRAVCDIARIAGDIQDKVRVQGGYEDISPVIDRLRRFVRDEEPPLCFASVRLPLLDVRPGRDDPAVDIQRISAAFRLDLISPAVPVPGNGPLLGAPVVAGSHLDVCPQFRVPVRDIQAHVRAFLPDGVEPVAEPDVPYITCRKVVTLLHLAQVDIVPALCRIIRPFYVEEQGGGCGGYDYVIAIRQHGLVARCHLLPFFIDVEIHPLAVDPPVFIVGSHIAGIIPCLSKGSGICVPAARHIMCIDPVSVSVVDPDGIIRRLVA